MNVLPTTYKKQLGELYQRCNRREFVHPDPLEFLYRYSDIRDREIVGLVASSLAYGNVRQILKSVQTVLDRMHRPYEYLLATSQTELVGEFRDFKHRFTTGLELATMLWGVKRVLKHYGSLNACFSAGLESRHENVIPALSNFVKELSKVFDERPRSLLPSPDLGSACKRLHLFLRWMVRTDDVDPGGWDDVPRSRLLVPVDIHMHRIALALGFTGRKQANLRTALEITAAFRTIQPEDPVRYDFCLTRLGIHPQMNPEDFLSDCCRSPASQKPPFDLP
jgi:uncharacterized protein (TIGR02757 family)